MVETIIFLLCAPLNDNKFRGAEYLSQHSNYLIISHLDSETIFDVKGLYKSDGSNCYWVNIFNKGADSDSLNWPI